MNDCFTWYDLHGIVTIRLKAERLEPFLAFFQTTSTKMNEISIDVEVKKKINIEKKGLTRIGDFYYNEDLDALYIDQPYPLPAQLLISGINTTEVKIVVTPLFLRLPTILRGGINFTYLFRETLLLKLLERNHLFLHTASVENNGIGILLPAFTSTGKSFTAFGLVKEAGASFLSDEYVVANSQGKLLAFPTVSAVSPWFIKRFGIKLTVKESLTLSLNKIRSKMFPFMFEPIIWIPSYDIVGKEKITSKTNSDYVIFLERGPNKIIEIDGKLAVEKLITITQFEFPFFSNPVFQAYSYVNQSFKLDNFLSKERETIDNLIQKSRKCFVVSSEGKHLQLISTLFKNGFDVNR